MSVGETLYVNLSANIAVTKIDTLDRPLRGRFVDRVAAGCEIQLLLNHEHMNFMEGAMARLASAA
jgi:hypothetical protein